jgi:hypothetical protein
VLCVQGKEGYIQQSMMIMIILWAFFFLEYLQIHFLLPSDTLILQMYLFSLFFSFFQQQQQQQPHIVRHVDSIGVQIFS